MHTETGCEKDLRRVRQFDGVPDLACFTEQLHYNLEPVVLRNSCFDWQPVREWSPERLEGKLADQMLRISSSASGYFPDTGSTCREKLSGRAFFERLKDEAAGRSPRYSYLDGSETFFNLGGESSSALVALEPEARPPRAVLSPFLVKSALWIGGGGVHSGLHYDGNGCNNFNVQVCGRKSIILLSPKYIDRLSMLSPDKFAHLGHFSGLSLDRDDMAGHPAFSELTLYHAVLDPGDVLFIPALWFHAVTSLEAFNANVNFWTLPDSTYLTPLLKDLVT